MARIINEKNVTLEDILNEADQMWKDYKKMGITDDNAEVIRREHKDFCASYPVVLRYMNMGEYSHKAMYKFLRYVKNNPWKSADEFIEAQTKYIVLLYKETHPHYTTTHVNNLKENVKRLLSEEHAEFEAMVKDNTRIVEEREERLKKKTLAEMKAFYEKHGEDAIYVPIRTASDLPGGSVHTKPYPLIEPTRDAIKISANDLLS